ncbi:MAG TPA: hypothetical protein VGW34_11255 [Allosphingosinicella sp.]|nr:hypothetical protein [Allosphingosinicella sp.]
MAGAQLNLSRRALLGAVCVAPVAPVLSEVEGRHPGLDPGSSFFFCGGGEGRWTPDQVRGDERRPVTNWDRALARFRKADAALAAAAHTLDEALYDRLGARHDTALRRLLRTPAPDLPALALKLDLALDDRAVDFVGDAAAMKALKQDARRLASRR